MVTKKKSRVAAPATLSGAIEELKELIAKGEKICRETQVLIDKARMKRTLQTLVAHEER